MAGESQFNGLHSPYAIRHVTLRNRMVKLWASMVVAAGDLQMSDLNLCFYETAARRGMGLVIVEHGFSIFRREIPDRGASTMAVISTFPV